MTEYEIMMRNAKKIIEQAHIIMKPFQEFMKAVELGSSIGGTQNLSVFIPVEDFYILMTMQDFKMLNDVELTASENFRRGTVDGLIFVTNKEFKSMSFSLQNAYKKSL